MKSRYAICVHNRGYEVSLIPRKIYEVIPDERAKLDGLVRTVDEDGEDYLYHENHFVFIELPEEVERVLIAAA